MDASQRAMVAARIANLPLGANQYGEGVGISTGSAAALLNVSRDSVQNAKVAQRAGTPELVAAVEQGKVAVSTDAQIAQEPRRALRAPMAAPGEGRLVAWHSAAAGRRPLPGPIQSSSPLAPQPDSPVDILSVIAVMCGILPSPAGGL
jgi:hypothetical protein